MLALTEIYSSKNISHGSPFIRPTHFRASGSCRISAMDPVEQSWSKVSGMS